MPKSNTSYQLDPSDQPDPDSDGARRMLGNLGEESCTLRLAKKGEIDGYVLCGKRFWTLASLRVYRARQIAKGPQFEPPVHKRKPGRPRKHPASEASVAAAE